MAGIPVTTKRGSQVTWEGDLTPPVVSYAASVRKSPLFTGLTVPASTNGTRSAVVDRKATRKGLLYFYSHGGIDMPAQSVPTPGAGGVANSRFQRTLVQLHDWVINTGWYMGGYPRNLGYSFRQGQLQTQVSGGSGPGMMQQRPLFPAVQNVPRYASPIRRYATRSSRS